MTATAAPAPRPGPGSGLPVLGALSPLARVFLLVTIVASVVAVILDFGLHASSTVVSSRPAPRSWAWRGSWASRRSGSGP